MPGAAKRRWLNFMVWKIRPASRWPSCGWAHIRKAVHECRMPPEISFHCVMWLRVINRLCSERPLPNALANCLSCSKYYAQHSHSPFRFIQTNTILKSVLPKKMPQVSRWMPPSVTIKILTTSRSWFLRWRLSLRWTRFVNFPRLSPYSSRSQVHIRRLLTFYNSLMPNV